MFADLVLCASVFCGYIFGVPLALCTAVLVLYLLAYGLLIALNTARRAYHRARRKFYRRLYDFAVKKMSA